MIDVSIYKNEKKECVGFRVSGHAGMAVSGQDIVCAAASVLIINTINAIERFTNDKASVDFDEHDGTIIYQLSGHPCKETALLLDTMILGLQEMVDDENYEEYIDLTFKEV